MLYDDDDLETLKDKLIKEREKNRAKLDYFESIQQTKASLDALFKRSDDLFRKIEEERQREGLAVQESQDEKTSPKV